MAAAEATSAALERVMTRFGRMLRSVGLRRGMSEQELDELTQEVRVRLWRALPGSERIERVQSSYVYQAALSAALDMVRRSRREVGMLSLERMTAPGNADTAHAGATPDTALERRELGESIDRAIEELDRPRGVVVRLHLSGYDRFEIARLLGWTEPKVRNLIYRGLADLRARLARQGITPGRMP
jgi:RNA polymerase sigma factor (sigma-70 family)